MKETDKGLSVLGLTMMALGTVIGGSFFLGSAIAIKTAGPGVLVAYLFGGFLVFLIMFALSEMTVADPSSGSFRTFSQQMFGPVAGFTVGWVYWTGLILAMSSEAAAVSIFLTAWFPNMSVPLTGSLVIIGVTLANLLGANRLSKLESGLASIKLVAIVGFVVLAASLIFGIFPNKSAVGLGALTAQTFFPSGIRGIAGSMLIVMFTYAGFEIIGLAASETDNPHHSVPRAITYTVIVLTGLYLTAIALLLPLIPTSTLTPDISPMVAALTARGLSWAAGVINIVLVTAILSTMLAATFGLARMMRSLAQEGYAPKWMKDNRDIPYRGILFSGFAMLSALALGYILPKNIYLFLVSSGGFALLFTYLVILITHYKFRKIRGCPPNGKCQLPGYPYTSWLAIAALIAIIASMPLIPGQASGLIAGLLLIIFCLAFYFLSSYLKKIRSTHNQEQ